MARKLTKKQRGFVNAKADGKPGVIAVLENYDTTDYNTAKSIASENLTKPYIVKELEKLGFDSNNAKRVIGQILNDEDAEYRDRIKAAENVFKVHSDYAPEKSININIEPVLSPEAQELAHALLGRQKDT